MRLAALTMAYNEPVWARVWARYYARQVGAAHCYLLDHGSDDGSTEGLEVRVERMARTALDEDARAAQIGARVAGLLGEYDAVVHSDVDELVVADPGRFADLRAYAASMPGEVATAVGLDVQHVPDEEAALDVARTIGEQRSFVRFSAAMCKPVLVRRAVRWSPGFHRCDAGMVVDGLFLFHLRYADLGLGLTRLERTRGQAFARADTNSHQRVSDASFAEMVTNIAQLPREEVTLSELEGEVAAWIGRVRAGQAAGENWLNLAGDRLWRLPTAWRGLF